ncbi:MAG TPA: hypothetical protein VHP83_03985 [Aggregatilineaceae bacterium]|nr:hypothetical protein [Aggregatilineaceae bacterium]
MSKFFEKLKDEPIILYTASFDGDVEIVSALGAELSDILNKQSERVYYISNMLSVVDLDLDGLTKLAAAASWGSDSPFRHRNIKEVLIVTRNEAIGSAAQNFGSQIYGNIPVSVFETLEEALDYARNG